MIQSENIKVNIRIRPLNFDELQGNQTELWNIQDSQHITVKKKYQTALQHDKPKINISEIFQFDQTYNQTQSNRQIYEQNIKPIVDRSLLGENGTVFLYGQTGAGKTYTMIGNRKSIQPQVQQKRKRNSTINLSHDDTNTSILQQKCRTPLKSKSIYAKNNTPIRKRSIFEQVENSIHQTENIHSIYAPQQDGILTLSLQEIFQMVNLNIVSEPGVVYTIYCSYYEVYNEKIYDLLSNNVEASLEIRENSSKNFFIQGLGEEVVTTVAEIIRILDRGEINRHYAQTKLNHNSSRSHTIFRIKISRVLNQCSQYSVLNFVDLAGSENFAIHDEIVPNSTCQDKSKVNQKKMRQTESKNINKSLFNLTRVIKLKSEQQQHIPYRDSSITKVLKEALGGNSRTLIICCLNPCKSQFENSYNTIQFGINAKKIQNQIIQNQRSHNLKEQEIMLKKVVHDISNKLEVLQIENLNQQDQTLKESYHEMQKNLMEKKNYINECIEFIQKSNCSPKQNKSVDSNKTSSVFDKQVENSSIVVNSFSIEKPKKQCNIEDSLHKKSGILLTVGKNKLKNSQVENNQMYQDIENAIQQELASQQAQRIQQLQEQLQQKESEIQSLQKQQTKQKNSSQLFNQKIEENIQQAQNIKELQLLVMEKETRIKQQSEIIALYENCNHFGYNNISDEVLKQIEYNTEKLNKNINYLYASRKIQEHSENPEEDYQQSDFKMPTLYQVGKRIHFNKEFYQESQEFRLNTSKSEEECMFYEIMKSKLDNTEISSISQNHGYSQNLEENVI